MHLPFTRGCRHAKWHSMHFFNKPSQCSPSWHFPPISPDNPEKNNKNINEPIYINIISLSFFKLLCCRNCRKGNLMTPLFHASLFMIVFTCPRLNPYWYEWDGQASWTVDRRTALECSTVVLDTTTQYITVWWIALLYFIHFYWIDK